MLLLAPLLPLLVLRQLETHSGKAAADVPSTIEIILQCDPAEAETISSLLFLSLSLLYIYFYFYVVFFFLFNCVFLLFFFLFFVCDNLELYLLLCAWRQFYLFYVNNAGSNGNADKAPQVAELGKWLATFWGYLREPFGS